MTPEELERHKVNLAELRAVRLRNLNLWCMEDAARAATRAEMLAALDQGLADLNAVSGMDAGWEDAPPFVPPTDSPDR